MGLVWVEKWETTVITLVSPCKELPNKVIQSQAFTAHCKYQEGVGEAEWFVLFLRVTINLLLQWFKRRTSVLQWKGCWTGKIFAHVAGHKASFFAVRCFFLAPFTTEHCQLCVEDVLWNSTWLSEVSFVVMQPWQQLLSYFFFFKEAMLFLPDFSLCVVI